MASEEKGNKMLIYIIAGVGVLGLGVCCLGGVGVGAWLYLSGPSRSGIEAKIVGKWVSDPDPAKKGPIIPGHIEFKADGTVVDTTPLTPFVTGKWKSIATKDDLITVEMSRADVIKNLDIKIVSNDSIKITPADSKIEHKFKRAP
jgi:hypothetical protein